MWLRTADPVAQLLISVSINQYDEFITILDHRHPNSVTFDKQNGMLYIGDSLGVIHVYDYSVTTLALWLLISLRG